MATYVLSLRRTRANCAHLKGRSRMGKWNEERTIDTRVCHSISGIPVRLNRKVGMQMKPTTTAKLWVRSRTIPTFVSQVLCHAQAQKVALRDRRGRYTANDAELLSITCMDSDRSTCLSVVTNRIRRWGGIQGCKSAIFRGFESHTLGVHRYRNS